MKINKKFFEKLNGSLSKDKITNKTKDFENIFKIINKLNPNDNKIDLEEITNFVASIWQEDDGDGKISDNEIESYIQKHQNDFKNTGLNAKNIRNFLEFYIKNSDKSSTDMRINNNDGTYSIITIKEEFETQKIAPQKQLDKVNPDSKLRESIIKLIPKTIQVSKGLVHRKINYNSKNQITSIEETKGNETTIKDANDKILQKIIKNEGAKDTIIDYAYLEDGSIEQSIFYGENGNKDSQKPSYKNIYNNNQLVSKFEYDSSGNIISRQDYANGIISSVTNYVNGVESLTTDLHTNGIYNFADAVADGVIDPVQQNQTGDCYLLNVFV